MLSCIFPVLNHVQVALEVNLLVLNFLQLDCRLTFPSVFEVGDFGRQHASIVDFCNSSVRIHGILELNWVELHRTLLARDGKVDTAVFEDALVRRLRGENFARRGQLLLLLELLPSFFSIAHLRSLPIDIHICFVQCLT